MTSRAGLLDLIAAAVEAGWSLRRACGLLEVNHSRVPAGPDAVRRIIRLDYHTGDLTTAVSHTCTRTTSAGSARSPRRPARLARRVALAAAAAGRTPRPAARIDVPRLHWTPADLAPLADPRLQPFTIGHDLFGALVTLPTPGHTRGSLSLFVRRPAAAALLLVDPGMAILAAPRSRRRPARRRNGNAHLAVGLTRSELGDRPGHRRARPARGHQRHPTCPNDCAWAASHNRRCRSSRNGAIAAYLSAITCSVVDTPAGYAPIRSVQVTQHQALTLSSRRSCGPGSSTSRSSSGTTAGRQETSSQRRTHARRDHLRPQGRDAIELVEFLRAYLHTDIVILLAESMGHLDRPPGAAPAHLFSAYVATDLYVDMVGNETVKYRLTLDRLRAAATATP